MWALGRSNGELEAMLQEGGSSSSSAACEAAVERAGCLPRSIVERLGAGVDAVGARALTPLTRNLQRGRGSAQQRGGGFGWGSVACEAAVARAGCLPSSIVERLGTGVDAVGSRALTPLTRNLQRKRRSRASSSEGS